MSVQLKPPPQRHVRRALEALFREARLLERKRRRRLAILVLLACAAVASVAYVMVTTTGAITPGARSPSAGLAVGAVVVPKQPSSLAVGPGGHLYIADDARHQILEWTGHGTFRVVAGSGLAGFSGDGGAALRARLDQPAGMTVAADGTLYFADIGEGRIRAISPTGTINTIAGDGPPVTDKSLWVASGTPALQAGLGEPNDVALGPHGTLYFDGGANEVLRLNHDGTLTVVAGNRSAVGGITGIGGPATKASPDEPWGLTLDARGDLFINGNDTKTLLMVTPDGRITTPIGLSAFYPRGPGGMITTSSGEVVAMTDEAIVRLTPHSATTIVNLCCSRVPRIGVFELNGIAPAPHGGLYTDTDQGNGFATTTALADIRPGGRIHLLWTSAK